MCTKLICGVDAKRYYPEAKTAEQLSFYGEHSHAEKDSKKTHSGTIFCSHCNNKVNLLPFGGGWVGVCCKQLVYNNRNLPDAPVE
jgi:hypothetical protein